MAKTTQNRLLFWRVGLALLLTGCNLPTEASPAQPVAEPGYTVILDGLNEPRGMWQRADHSLCVAETGRLIERREGEFTVSLTNTGSLLCLDAAGRRERVVEGLPYAHYGASGVSVGPTDVAELDGVLYLLTAEGDERLSRSLLRIGPEQTPQKVADFLDFATGSQPLEYFLPGEITSNPYAMIPDPANRRFLVTDGATGQVMAAGLNGQISVYAALEEREVLTGIAWGPNGLAYVASFSQLPHQAGAGAVLAIRPNGVIEVVLSGLTTPIDLAFDQLNRLYVLEFVYASETGDPYRGKTGRLIRFTPYGERRWGSPKVLVEGLPYPTALLINTKNEIYLTINGAFSPPASGAVLYFAKLVSQPEGELPIQYRP